MISRWRVATADALVLFMIMVVLAAFMSEQQQRMKHKIQHAALWESLTSSTPKALLVVDARSSRIVDANSAAERLLAPTHTAVIEGKPLPSVLPLPASISPVYGARAEQWQETSGWVDLPQHAVTPGKSVFVDVRGTVGPKDAPVYLIMLAISPDVTETPWSLQLTDMLTLLMD